MLFQIQSKARNDTGMSSVKGGVACRKGIATLEFAMCLPILLLLFAAILWLGVWFSGQSEITVVARNRVWHERHHGNAGDAFKLDQVVGEIKPTVLEDRSRSFSPMFPVRLKSEHCVLGGSWDYHQVEINKQPSWALYLVATKGAITFDRKAFDPISAAQSSAGGLLGQLSQYEGDLSSAGQNADAGAAQGKSKRKQQNDEKIMQLEGERQTTERLLTKPEQRDLGAILAQRKRLEESLQRLDSDPKSEVPLTPEFRAKESLRSERRLLDMQKEKVIRDGRLTPDEQQVAGKYANNLKDLDDAKRASKFMEKYQ